MFAVMNCHMPFAFEGWERVRTYGQLACFLYKWAKDSRMIPMPIETGPEFEDAKQLVLRATGLELAGWVIFARSGWHTQLIHSDCTLGPPGRNKAALNVPIIGGPGSRMEWFSDRQMTMLTSVYGTDKVPRVARYFVPAEEAKQEEEPMEVCHFTEAPVLVDTYHPHRVIAGPEARAVVSMRFVGNPSVDDIRLAISQRSPVE
jgi:hypothetical protein